MKIPLEKKEAKILFVNPCLRKGAESKLPPVGLTYVMTMFKENGYDFSLLDIDINEFDDSYVEDYVKNNKYDFVLLGSIVTHYKWIKWFVNTVKDFHPTTNVIVGNSVDGSIPETFFEKTLADVIVIGEGEYSALDAVDAIRLGKNLEEVEGIACRDKNGKALITPPKEVGNINEIPMIDWELVEIQRYLKTAGGFLDKNEKAENTRILPVATARGCAFKCTFCHYVFWNDPYRNRSPESIIEEIKRDIEKYNVNYINFWDDLSFASSVHVERLCDAIIESGLKFKWSASIRVDVFTRARLTRDESLKVAKKMKQSGCYSCGFSLESGNQEILEMMNNDAYWWL